MPDSPSRDAVKATRSQLRRVRWRKNLYELQRLVYFLVALVLAAASATVVLALRGRPEVFAASGWGVAALAIALGAWIGVVARRRWLAAAEAPSWVDRRAGLGGRLTTLIELEPRGRAQPFFPLLVEENARGLGRWTPETLLPDVFPRGALTAALVAGCALLAALFLGSRLAPPPIEVVLSDRPLARLKGATGDSSRALIAEDEEKHGPLARLPARLQEEIRRRLWGKSWQASGQAVGRAPAASAARPSEPVDEEQLERSWQIARAGRTGRPSRGAGEEAPAERKETARRGSDAKAPSAARRGEGGEPGRPAAGAGDATDPNLFAHASVEDGGAGTFELPIAARVRALGGGPRPPEGEAPPAVPDARPGLGARQRRDAPVPRMGVPPAYAPIVRRLFAHTAP